MLDLSGMKTNFQDTSNMDLINYIFKRHHSFLKDSLYKISYRILVIYDAYYDEAKDMLEELYINFTKLKLNLEIHMMKEEKSLFFKIRDLTDLNTDENLESKINEEILDLENNNNKIEFALSEIKRVTNDYTYGTEKHSGFDKIYRDLKEIEQETNAHLELERDLLYKRIKNRSKK